MFKTGDWVKFHGLNEYGSSEGVRRYHPADAKCLGLIGVVEVADKWPQVRMPNGHLLTGWHEQRYTPCQPLGKPVNLMLLGESHRLLIQQFTSVDAAMQFLRESGLTGREYEIYDAAAPLRRVKVQETTTRELVNIE